MRIAILTLDKPIVRIDFDTQGGYKTGIPLVNQLTDRERRGVLAPIGLLDQAKSAYTPLDHMEVLDAIQETDTNRVIVVQRSLMGRETARALGGIPGKTIVLTGARLPARRADSRTHINLAAAVGAVQVLPPGVYVVENGRVYPGNRR